MSPRTPDENAIVRERAAAHLLTTALKVFTSRGYHSSSMAELAREAGVSKGLAYHYFESKEALLIALAEQRLKEWSVLIEKLESIDKPDERLSFLIHFTLRELRERTDELRFYNSLYLNEEGARAIKKAMKKSKLQFDRLFRAEQKLFEDLGFKNAALEAILFRSTLQGISFEYMLAPQDYPIDEVQRALLTKYRRPHEK